MRGLLAGALSGFVLGFFLKAVELISDIKVYTLLLNVDFIPYIGNIHWPEWIEFFFHLIISLLLGIILQAIMRAKPWNVYGVAFILTFPTVFLYFPLSVLSIKEVPAVHDMTAFSLWTIGHILYALSLAFSYDKSPYQTR